MSYQIIKGPALLRGQAVGDINIRTKGDIIITKKISVTAISTDDIANMDMRLEDVVHEIKFTPEGQWTTVTGLLNGAAMNPATHYPGQKILNNVSASVTGVADATGGICTLTFSASKKLYKGQYIYLHGSSVGAYDGARLVTADSTGTTATVVMTYSATATATAKIPPCLIIHPINQYAETEGIIIYQNAGITGLPEMTFAANATVLGEVTVSAVYHPYLTASDAESLLRRATWAAPVSTVLDDLDASLIFTHAPRLRYAEYDANEFTGTDSAAAPWADFRSLEGMKVTLSMGLVADKTDYRGTQNWTFTGLSLVATATPVSGVATDEITDDTIQALLRQQDDGADGLMRGVSLKPTTPLELLIAVEDSSGTYKLRIPHAVVTGAAAGFGTNAPRNGALQWTATRKVTAGVQNALYSFED